MRELSDTDLDAKLSRMKEKHREGLVNGDDLPFHLRIQNDIIVEKRVEKMQKETFFNLIRKREELKHLQPEQDELFIEFWIDFLKGKTQSINNFLYSNGECNETDPKERAKDFFSRKNYKLKEKFK